MIVGIELCVVSAACALSVVRVVGDLFVDCAMVGRERGSNIAVVTVLCVVWMGVEAWCCACCVPTCVCLRVRECVHKFMVRTTHCHNTPPSHTILTLAPTLQVSSFIVLAGIAE